MTGETPSEFVNDLLKNAIEYGISGPGVATMLFQAGLNLEDTRKALSSVGFEAYVDPEKNQMSVSIKRFSGNDFPIVPPKFEAKTVTFPPKNGWLDEIE